VVGKKTLRNADNAEKEPWMRLELTLVELQQLQHCLRAELQRHPAQDDQCQTLQPLLTKLENAAMQASRPSECAVCHHWFSQDQDGRTGHYCSAACKQKAYRQRQLAARKQFGPSPKR
jgi:hypothetical protein